MINGSSLSSSPSKLAQGQKNTWVCDGPMWTLRTGWFACAALVWRKGGDFIFTEPKTSRSRRSIPLSNSAVDELKKYKRRQGERRLKLGEQDENHDLVFATEMGTPL